VAQNALTTLNAREIAPIQRYGDWLTRRVANVLAARFAHRNADGSLYTPRIIESVTFPPYYHLIVVDPEALWHISKDRMTAPDVLDALTAAAQRLVRPITRIPDETGRVRHGLAYAILLRDLPQADDEVRLPRVARLDLATRDVRGRLQVPLGVSARGDEWRHLADIGHALIVGATGAGKSTFIHTALAALLTQNAPNELRVALIDPKRSELTIWGRARHLLAPIATTPEQATRILIDVVAEMDRRGDLLARALVRDIRTYNTRSESPLPYILVVIDECLDLVLADGARVEQPLKTIAIRGRSAGVYLWAATQHASAISGLPRVVNVNLATRIVFRVTDASAAQVAGCPGAQNIPRNVPGRMLAKLNDAPMMMQAYYLPDDDLAAVARGVSDDGAAQSPRGDALVVSNDEREMIEWAVRDNNGYLTIADIVARGVGVYQARRIADELERRGVLVKDPRADNRRRVSDTVVQLLGLSV
jgi:S-DNA-T family DNA segregation ATPase FtsK/SpoIIIE